MTATTADAAPADPLYAPRWVSSEELPHHAGSQILPGLFMGGTDDFGVVQLPATTRTVLSAEDYDAVVTLYSWAHPVDWHVEELRYGFGDSQISASETDRIVEAARWAHKRWSSGARTLIRCQAGLNRSGLITALVLIIDGHTPEEAIRRIRAERSPFALCNDSFVHWLLVDATAALSN